MKDGRGREKTRMVISIMRIVNVELTKQYENGTEQRSEQARAKGRKCGAIEI